jgi:disulfide bond formation protein DsbB
MSAMLASLARLPWPPFAALASAAMLATAHVFQHFGYAPCPLCLRQREVYWAAIAIALLGFALIRMRRMSPAVVNLLLGVVFLAGVVVAGFHAGVEWKWWPGPASCGSLGLGDIDAGDLSALLAGTAEIRAPACDEAAWRMLGLSMAGWNVLVSAGLAAISFGYATRKDPA